MRYLLFFFFCITTIHATDRSSYEELLFELRDPSTGKQRFRKCLEKIGEYLAWEIVPELDGKDVTITTLTNAPATHHIRNEEPVLIAILRAGVPLCYGVQKVFPQSEVGFLGMARNEETLKAKVDYIALPDLTGKTVVFVDTMVGTGGSIIDAIQIIEKKQPKKIIVFCAFASQPGIDRILAYNPSVKIIAASIDPILNERGYIVPGLGDAGDRSYGPKSSLR